MIASKEHDQFVLDLIQEDMQSVGVSLVGYSFEQLDERRGIQRVFATRFGMIKSLHRAVSIRWMESQQSWLWIFVERCAFAVMSRGTPDASEIMRMMRDLAKLRGLPMAGRGELIEAVQSCLVHGELHGRAREVARALESVLIGNRRGKVTDKAPRCGWH